MPEQVKTPSSACSANEANCLNESGTDELGAKYIEVISFESS